MILKLYLHRKGNIRACNVALFCRVFRVDALGAFIRELIKRGREKEREGEGARPRARFELNVNTLTTNWLPGWK